MADPLAEKMVQPALNPEHVAYCPTMDLIAVATVDDLVHVYRLNGQEVFGVANRQDTCEIRKVKWKPDGIIFTIRDMPRRDSMLLIILPGQSLAVAFSNRFLCLTNSHTGKTIYRVDCSSYSDSQICCLGWSVVLSERNGLNEFVNQNSHLDLDDFIGRNPQIKNSDTPADLPKDLAFLEIEGLLPRLSPLSSGGIE